EACISGWAMLQAEPVVIEDIYADRRVPHDAYRPTFVKSLCMVPIGWDQPVGAIGCYWASAHLANDEELELQQAVADTVAIGLNNLNLYQEMAQARQAAEASAEEARVQGQAREAEQSAALEAQIEAGRKAKELMEEAFRASKEAETARDALKESERTFRLLTEQIPAIVYRALLNHASETIYISPKVADLGYQQQEWLDTPGLWLSLLHPDDKERVLRQLAEWSDTGGPLFLEYRLRDKAGVCITSTISAT
ncbi:MAG: PAS domain-containing protein, partial [Methylomonas sp.]|nr:PAS domain-containing protein [Methylomonas sp.]